MGGTEEEETKDVPITPVDDDDEDEGVYADHVTSEE